jgi:hypothetical protein
MQTTVDRKIAAERLPVAHFFVLMMFSPTN